MPTAVINYLLGPDLRLMLEEGDADGLKAFCEELHPAALAELLAELEDETVWRVLSHCALPRQVEIFEFLSLHRQVELVEAIGKERLSKLVGEMSSDDRADLLSRLDPVRVESLLPLMAQADRADVRRLLAYPEESAGSIMTTEYASLTEQATVAEALTALRKQAPDAETLYYIYVLGPDRRLDGFVSLRDLVLARPERTVGELMRRDVISARVDDDQEKVAAQVMRYDLLALPVVDEANRLVGIVTHDDAMDVVRQEAEEDVLRMGGVEPLADSYAETGVLELAWKRGKWLMFLSLVALATAQVLQRFEEVSEAHVWLVLFLPLVLAAGGNAGSQSAALIIRAIALGEQGTGPWRLAARELLVGGTLGFLLALIGYLSGYLWFELGSNESLMVAGTVFVVVVIGTVCGSLLPLASKKMGADPALMSTPLITAVMDVTGVILYYGVGIWLLTTLAGTAAR
ncbi:magnesium transporter [Alienimonas californiensis]|uniref:Magnesium transporter MgtE n=1 Tax=Alienimonas californiensis TaxID=2527989 RepID=A0A517P3Z7_9PLAN|nr:magnesium transporter [Alienimonas californiensis]QDT14089.1 Magnesium transporter MgtE [Alienimonas californiensis]